MKTFGPSLINWYLVNKRELPWRETTDPYKIWLSEIILQQTRVDQGLPYYRQFVESFPTVRDLAAAGEDEVLRKWQGLGYYSRARNLHHCAKVIAEVHHEIFPSNYTDLLNLPGIGPYTAAAIASIAFGEEVPVIDGNVFRVLSRVFGIDANIADAKNRKIFFELASELINGNDPASFNQGLMEFGALHCLPKNPNCSSCIFGDYCIANQTSRQSELPVKKKQLKIRQRYFHYLVIQRDGQFLMRKRGNGDIWEGLYDFFLIEDSHFYEEDELVVNLRTQGLVDFEVLSLSVEYKHVLTHQRIHGRFYRIESNDRTFALKNDLRFYSISEIEALPKPRLIEGFLIDEDILSKLN